MWPCGEQALDICGHRSIERPISPTVRFSTVKLRGKELAQARGHLRSPEAAALPDEGAGRDTRQGRKRPAWSVSWVNGSRTARRAGDREGPKGHGRSQLDVGAGHRRPRGAAGATAEAGCVRGACRARPAGGFGGRAGAGRPRAGAGRPRPKGRRAARAETAEEGEPSLLAA